MASRHSHLHLLVLLLCLIGLSVEAIQIRVENRGAYIARALIRYENGKKQVQQSNSGSLASFQTATIDIDNSARSLEIDVQVYLFFNSLRTIFKTSNPCPHTRCFVVWGSVFKTEWNEVCCS